MKVKDTRTHVFVSHAFRFRYFSVGLNGLEVINLEQTKSVAGADGTVVGITDIS